MLSGERYPLRIVMEEGTGEQSGMGGRLPPRLNFGYSSLDELFEYLGFLEMHEHRIEGGLLSIAHFTSGFDKQGLVKLGRCTRIIGLRAKVRSHVPNEG